MLRHFEVQHIASIGIGAGDIFVQFDTQTRRSRWNDMPLFKTDGRFQNLSVKTTPTLNAFKNEEVW